MDQSRAPIAIFGGEGVDTSTPRVFFSTHRYVQGAGALSRLGDYLPLVDSHRPGLMLPDDLPGDVTATVLATLEASGLKAVRNRFGGQCCHEEIDRQVAFFRTANVDAIVAAGGGKVIDTAKCVAFRLGVSLVICPTLASTDAPCSAAAVVYTEQGMFKDVEFFPGNPNLVVVDTAIIAKAPLRYLVAGMADALATGYEAKTCFDNPNSRSMVGGKISLAASAIATLCSQTIYKRAEEAVAAVRSGHPTEALEEIVEANTLLSGTGFESGGLAAAHAIATALTLIASVEHQFLHGEMVAIGLLTQLKLEENETEFQRARDLLRRLGLPTKYSDIGLGVEDDPRTEKLAEDACSLPFMANEPFAVTPGLVLQAMKNVEADSETAIAST